MNGRKRKRNACLAALEKMIAWRSDILLKDVVAFLYICENEGATLRELAILARLDQSTASRTISRLAGAADRSQRSPEALIRPCTRNDDKRARTLLLTPHGIALRDDIEGIIARAEPIEMRD